MQYAIDDEPWETIHTPMPLRLGSLTIIDLGRIEFTKPRFHDTNYIWPVGFTSTRVYVGPCLALLHGCVFRCEAIQLPATIREVSDRFGGSDVRSSRWLTGTTT